MKVFTYDTIRRIGMFTFSTRLEGNSTYSYTQNAEITDISTQQTSSPPEDLLLIQYLQ